MTEKEQTVDLSIYGLYHQIDLKKDLSYANAITPNSEVLFSVVGGREQVNRNSLYVVFKGPDKIFIKSIEDKDVIRVCGYLSIRSSGCPIQTFPE